MKFLSAIATLSLIASPVNAGSHSFNVGFTAGVLSKVGCAMSKGRITKDQAAETMVALMTQQGISADYAGRQDVLRLAVNITKANGC